MLIIPTMNDQIIQQFTEAIKVLQDAISKEDGSNSNLISALVGLIGVIIVAYWRWQAVSINKEKMEKAEQDKQRAQDRAETNNILSGMREAWNRQTQKQEETNERLSKLIEENTRHISNNDKAISLLKQKVYDS